MSRQICLFDLPSSSWRNTSIWQPDVAWRLRRHHGARGPGRCKRGALVFRHRHHGFQRDVDATGQNEPHGADQRVLAGELGDEAQRATADRGLHRFQVVGGGYDHHSRVRTTLLEPVQHAHAGIPRHGEIEQDEIDVGVVAIGLDGLGEGVGFDHDNARIDLAQCQFQAFTHQMVIVRDE
nr:hypothetical protein [Hydrogenophaga sp. 2FB]